MGDRAYFSYELGHLGQGAVCPCLWCLQRFGKFGLCVNDPGTAAQRCKRTDEHYDRMAAIAKPMSEFKERVTSLKGPEPNLPGPGSVNLSQQSGRVGVHLLSETQYEFNQLLLQPELNALLQAAPFNFEGNQISSGIDHVRQATHSVFNERLTATPVDRFMSDVLHWIINISEGLIEFTDEAALQIGNAKALVLHRQSLVGDPEVTGYDGRQSQKLMEQFEKWTHFLESHPDYKYIIELLGFRRRVLQIYMLDFGPNDSVIDEFASCCANITRITDERFSGKPTQMKKKQVTYKCKCGPQNVFFAGKNIAGYLHACTPGTKDTPSVKLCTGRAPMLRVHGNYEHDTLAHMEDRMRAYGGPLQYSSWLI